MTLELTNTNFEAAKKGDYIINFIVLMNFKVKLKI